MPYRLLAKHQIERRIRELRHTYHKPGVTASRRAELRLELHALNVALRDRRAALGVIPRRSRPKPATRDLGQPVGSPGGTE